MNEPIDVTTPVDKADLINLLKENTVFVTFNKRDGSERTMRCTLMDAVVVPHEKTTDRVKEPNPNTVPVWDLDLNAWRSFRLDTIKHVSYDVKL